MGDPNGDPAAALLPLRCARTLHGHSAPLYAAVFNHDGSYCILGGADKLISLWNPYRAAEAGDESQGAFMLKQYRGHGYDVKDVALSRDNTRFASCGGDRCAFLWDTNTGATIRKLFGHEQRLNALAFNSEATLLFTASDDKTVRAWDLKAGPRSGGGSSLQVFGGFRDNVTGVVVLREEIIASCMDGTVRTFDIRAGKVAVDTVSVPGEGGGGVCALAVSFDSNCVLAACTVPESRGGGRMTLLERGTGSALRSYTGGHTNSLYQCRPAFTSSDSHVIAPSEDGSIALYDLVEGTVTAKLEGAHKRVVSVCASHPSPLHSIMLTASFDGTAKLWAAEAEDLSQFVVASAAATNHMRE